MGFIKKIIEGFIPQLTSEEESNIEGKISSFERSIYMLTGHYITASEEQAFSRNWNSAYKELKSTRVSRRHPLYPKVQEFLKNYEHLHDSIGSLNHSFMDQESRRCDALLSSIDGKSLDAQQREVVVCNDERNLVLAGAGSGKTLTIAGKVKYLCKIQNVQPDDILLIAFTKKSADEMTERIAGRLEIPVQATTFHKLGLDIITSAEGRRPDVLDDLQDFVHGYFEKNLVDDPTAARNLIEYFAYYINIPADMAKFDSLGAAYEFEKGADFETIRGKYERAKFVSQAASERGEEKRTLQNEQVKSMEEVSIANFLFLHGVKYEYERLYPFESSDPIRKAYRPDFYLSDYDIYLEHFGINREGKLPWLSQIEEEKYLDGIQWKRDFHRQNGTTLIETYSYYSSEEVLLDKLSAVLQQNGVKFKEPDFSDIFETVYATEGEKYFAEFIRLCSTFITLFKSNGHQINALPVLQSRNPAHNTPFFRNRTELFKQIILPILSAYEQYLSEHQAIDFSDMINMAANRVKSGFTVHPYKWVIIDEYQDISVARYELVKAILDQTGAKLLCVGDDWQSIYRFAGSDINLFTRFEHYFGQASIMRLEQTYRNSQQLIDEAGAFVMKNPHQYQKHLRSTKSLDYPITFMCYQDNPFSVLQRTINKSIQVSGAESSILILGRTNSDFDVVAQSGLFDVWKSGKVSYKESPKTPIFFLTVHRAKGLEADNVVLVNFQNSTLGFPNRISDDPILELVLTAQDEYLYAEERRLLYVALTRTKNRTFILVNEKRPSEFMREFQPSDRVFILSNTTKASAEEICCPRCKTGHLLIRKNESSSRFFVGCSNFPQCDFTVKDPAVMNNPQICPRCGGFLLKRRGKYGEFIGCTNYPTCSYTEQIQQPVK